MCKKFADKPCLLGMAAYRRKPQLPGVERAIGLFTCFLFSLPAGSVVMCQHACVTFFDLLASRSIACGVPGIIW